MEPEEGASPMTSTGPLNVGRREWLYDLSSSVYCGLLFIWFEESKPFAWPSRYVYFWHPHAASLRQIDFLLFYFEVFLVLGFVIFLGLRLIRLFSFSQALLRAGC